LVATKKMFEKIFLLYPPMILAEGERPTYTFPMGCGYIAAALETQGYEVRCLDAIAEDRNSTQPVGKKLLRFGLDNEAILQSIQDFSPDVIGFSCQFSVQYEPTKELVQEIKKTKPEIVTIIGGTHSSAQPEDVLREIPVDYVVISEGEETVVHLLKRLQEGSSLEDLDGLGYRNGRRIYVNSKTHFIKDLDSIPFPARHLFNMEKYLDTNRGWGSSKKRRRLSLITSRGCPFHCIFCGIHLNTGKKFRMRTPSSVLKEIQQVAKDYGVNEILFEDDNISINRARMMELVQGISDLELDISWSAPSGIALWTLDEELLEKMKESGCYKIYLGLESGNERVLKNVIRKHLCDKNEIRRRVKMIKKYGFETVGFWVLGNPGETKRDMWDTIDFARELGLDSNQVLIALPYKGTRLYDVCRENGYFAYSKHLDPNQMIETRALIRTEDFSPSDVIAIQKAGRFLAVYRKDHRFFTQLKSLFQQQGWLALKVLGEIIKKYLGFYRGTLNREERYAA
jgi:anaerobic magnesium-protoporphyrin IX monomethyl ester cyclase